MGGMDGRRLLSSSAPRSVKGATTSSDGDDHHGGGGGINHCNDFSALPSFPLPPRLLLQRILVRNLAKEAQQGGL